MLTCARDIFLTLCEFSDHEIHLFNSDHPVGSKEKKAFTNLEGPVCNGEIREIYFAACEEPNARTVVEALKFEFSFSQNTMVAQL